MRIVNIEFRGTVKEFLSIAITVPTDFTITAKFSVWAGYLQECPSWESTDLLGMFAEHDADISGKTARSFGKT